MNYLKKLERFIDKNRQRLDEPNPIPTLEQILGMRLSELSQRDLALRIFSEVLGAEIWGCGTEQMAIQIRHDNPGVTTYTVNELRKPYKLQPSPDDLRAIHNAKTVFEGSRIIVDSRLKETMTYQFKEGPYCLERTGESKSDNEN